MTDNELINALHNTIDLNKKVICKLLTDGTQKIEISFVIEAGEIAKFFINTQKCATKDFSQTEPFVFRRKEEKNENSK